MDMSHGDGALYWTSQETGQENKFALENIVVKFINANLYESV